MSNELMTEPPLDPPETPEDRKDAADYRLAQSLKRIGAKLAEPDEGELLLQQQAMQAEDDDLDYQMHMDEMPSEYRGGT